MMDSMMTMQKKVDEFGASNFTKILDYQIGRHLGQGAYASVKQAKHTSTGLVLAIKVYEKFNLMENYNVEYCNPTKIPKYML